MKHVTQLLATPNKMFPNGDRYFAQADPNISPRESGGLGRREGLLTVPIRDK